MLGMSRANPDMDSPSPDNASLVDAGRAGGPQASNTQRAYRADWADFAAWCAGHRVAPLPTMARTIAAYLGASAQYHELSTLRRRVAAIGWAHRDAGYQSPTTDPLVRAALSSIRRSRTPRQQSKAPVMFADLRAMVVSLPDSMLGERDRALLLLGFAGAIRRTELVSLDVADTSLNADGLVIHLRHTTEERGGTRTLTISRGARALTCPVRALEDWLAFSGIREGPLFRPVDRHGRVLPNRLSDRSVARIVQRAALAAGLDATAFAAHSLRAGLAASAAAAGASDQAIMAMTGHKSLPAVRRYRRDREANHLLT
jgi:site-specific recombinase XerD